MVNQKTFQNIIKAFFNIQSNKKIDKHEKHKIINFIESIINKEKIQAYLVIDANLDSYKKGIIIYILTDLRLIKIDTDYKELQSSSFLLHTILNIQRKLTKDNTTQIKIYFQTTSFGLCYATHDKQITEFFQKVDEARVLKVNNV